MNRATNAAASRKRRKRVVASASGYFGRSNRCFRLAKRMHDRGMCYQYEHRRAHKRNMRRLFIQRINAWARSIGLTYAQVIHKLKVTELNRKMIADLAFRSPEVLAQALKQAEAAKV